MEISAARRFGPFEFHPDTGELVRDGRTVRLEPQPARLLALLVARPGELVSREEIRRALWGEGVHVDVERGIAYALNQVRAALGDEAGAPRYVETLPRRGLRFVAPVDPAGDAAASGLQPARRGVAAALAGLALLAAIAWLAIARPWAAPPPVLLAVSAFDNETGAARHDPMVSRLADAVVARLLAADLPDVGVIGNAAVLRRPRAERDLDIIRAETGAGYVILGQLQPDPGGLRVIAHLIALEDGTHVWADRYVRAPGELAGLESEVADGVAAAVAEHLAAVPTPAGATP